jgi:hypothetical protein
MKESYRSAIDMLCRAIEQIDPDTAVSAAQALTDIREQFQIKEQQPMLCYRHDTDTESDCTAVTIHTLCLGDDVIGEWTRHSIGGIGLDRNHPEQWAAVAIEPRMSRYDLVVKPVLQILGLQDHAPSIPAPL